MSDSHNEVSKLIDECLDIMDRVASTVAEAEIEPTKSILKNIGMACGELLHAKKKVLDDAGEGKGVE